MKAVYASLKSFSAWQYGQKAPQVYLNAFVTLDHKTFTFTFSHLADTFIQSDLQLGVHKAINLEEANIQRKCQ